jgi:hypothetical protein
VFTALLTQFDNLKDGIIDKILSEIVMGYFSNNTAVSKKNRSGLLVLII